jgi:hypothetical protein
VIREAEAMTQLLYHLDGRQVLAESTLELILDRLALWASIVTGERVDYSSVRALNTLSLVVTA